jgi:hypothetical protein
MSASLNEADGIVEFNNACGTFGADFPDSRRYV